MMTSAMHSLSRSRARRPFSASISNHVRGSSQERMRSRCIASSSTTKTRVGPEGALYFRNQIHQLLAVDRFVRYPTAPSIMPFRRSSTIVAMISECLQARGRLVYNVQRDSDRVILLGAFETFASTRRGDHGETRLT